MELLEEIAKNFVSSAPNSDWRGRGKLMIVDVKTVAVTEASFIKAPVNLSVDVAIIMFEKPLKSAGSTFIGFMLAITHQDGKQFIDASPLFDFHQNHNALIDSFAKRAFLSRMCPECGKIDTVTKKILKRRREAVLYKLSCPCGYTDTDLFD